MEEAHSNLSVMRVPFVVALSAGLLLSGLSCTVQARPTPPPSPAKVHTTPPPPPVDLPPAWGLALPIILGSLGVMVLIFAPIGLILCWLISSDANTIDKRQGK